MAERYGTETTSPNWQARLVCGCGSRCVDDIVVSGTE